MYLGISPLVDFLVCAGLGVAAGACMLSGIHAIAALPAGRLSPSSQAMYRLLVFVVFGGALLALATVIGETKSERSPGSILGFVLGVLLTSPLITVARRNAPRA
jgi:hypothetical protein